MALVCAAFVLTLGALSVSPGAHGHLHSDAASDHHTCAIALFSGGIATADTSDTGIAGRIPEGRLAVEFRDAFYLAKPEFLLLPGRAPPSC